MTTMTLPIETEHPPYVYAERKLFRLPGLSQEARLLNLGASVAEHDQRIYLMALLPGRLCHLEPHQQSD
jgi:hypothetical protein